MDQVGQTGKPLLITKNGKPIASYAGTTGGRPALGSLEDHLQITGDILSPIDAEWDALK